MLQHVCLEHKYVICLNFLFSATSIPSGFRNRLEAFSNRMKSLKLLSICQSFKFGNYICLFLLATLSEWSFTSTSKGALCTGSLSRCPGHVCPSRHWRVCPGWAAPLPSAPAGWGFCHQRYKLFRNDAWFCGEFYILLITLDLKNNVIGGYYTIVTVTYFQ